MESDNGGDCSGECVVWSSVVGVGDFPGFEVGDCLFDDPSDLGLIAMFTPKSSLSPHQGVQPQSRIADTMARTHAFWKFRSNGMATKQDCRAGSDSHGPMQWPPIASVTRAPKVD